MLTISFVYIILPFTLAALLLRLLKKYAPNEISPETKRLYAEHPIEKGWFRAIRRDQREPRWLGDFETNDEAVERAYRGKEEAQAGKEKALFQVLNDKGEILSEIAS